MPAAATNCRPGYDDEIIVRTHLKNVRESVVHFGYELLRADGTLLAEGETTHVVTRLGDENDSTSSKISGRIPRSMGR